VVAGESDRCLRELGVKACEAVAVTLTEDLWDSIAPIYDQILDHPFVRGLTDGSLAPSAFAFYLRQDALYLSHYARALAILAGRAPTSEDTLMFARHAAGALEVERTLHESLLPELDIEPGSLAGAEFAPTNLAYTSYLLAAVHGGSYAEGVAAVLPCYWIYWEVGKELVKHGSPDSRYQRWIDTYGGEQFGLVVQEVLNASDELANDLTGHERDRLFLRFGTTARYEWMFWDMGYREEWWPI
jgi:thiaminase (transcriptional activator TenA)